MRLPRARKRFGQHFLADARVIGQIIAAIAPQPGDALVEIGPGAGALTTPLLAAGWPLDAVELDRDMAARLRHQFALQPAFHLHEADALRFDWRALAVVRGGPLRLIGNLPYNISTPLLFSLLDHADVIADMHFMLQREVVDRILAAPGSKTYGRLGVMLSPRVHCTRILDVAPRSFTPPPKVQSSVVRMVVVREPPTWALTPAYAAVVGAAFGQRRKTLRNSLSRLLSIAQLNSLGIDPGLRAEQLSPVQFGMMAQAIGAMLEPP